MIPVEDKVAGLVNRQYLSLPSISNTSSKVNPSPTSETRFGMKWPTHGFIAMKEMIVQGEFLFIQENICALRLFE